MKYYAIKWDLPRQKLQGRRTMKNIMFMGPVAAGKTSLIQRLKGEEVCYKKTQAIEFLDGTIDTPGEYIENRHFLYALTVTAADADIIIFVQDAVRGNVWYSPGQASMFGAHVIGVVTKIDIATSQTIDDAENILKLAGVEQVFKVSAYTAEGIDELTEYIRKIGS